MNDCFLCAPVGFVFYYFYSIVICHCSCMCVCVCMCAFQQSRKGWLESTGLFVCLLKKPQHVYKLPWRECSALPSFIDCPKDRGESTVMPVAAQAKAVVILLLRAGWGLLFWQLSEPSLCPLEGDRLSFPPLCSRDWLAGWQSGAVTFLLVSSGLTCQPYGYDSLARLERVSVALCVGHISV